eukprot:SM000014S00399  [mRNA]  locus=s14:1142220:1143346:- [translate_table: standard]
MALSTTVDALMTTLSGKKRALRAFHRAGVARGCGWQHIAAWVNLIAYYAVALPVGAALAFRADLGIVGLWIGLTAAMFTQFVAFAVVTATTDWIAQSRVAIERVGTGSMPNFDNGAATSEKGDYALLQ